MENKGIHTVWVDFRRRRPIVSTSDWGENHVMECHDFENKNHPNTKTMPAYIEAAPVMQMLEDALDGLEKYAWSSANKDDPPEVLKDKIKKFLGEIK